MAQRRLQILHQTGHLERTRINGTFAYFQGKQPGMLEHLLNLNWVRMWLQSELKSWEVLHQWVYEQDYGYLRADGFVSIRNSITGKHRFVFVEMDRGTNEFDKVRRYNRMYQKDGYAGWWWTKYADAFPTILVCTITPSRVKLIHSLIQEENKAGLEFQVVLLENIKEAVIWGKSSLTRFNRE